MGRLLTIPANGFSRPGIRQRTLTGSGVRVGPISLQLMLIVGLTLLGFFYVLQSNRAATGSLELKSLEAQKTQIVEENERLSVEAARLQSIQQLKRAAEEAKNPAAAAAKAATTEIQAGNVRPASAQGG